MKRRVLNQYGGWLLLLTVLLGGCNTDVELCRDIHPHRTLLDFRYVWDEEDEAHKPDSMYVVAIRLSRTIRYNFRVSSKPEGNQGLLLFPQEEQKFDSIDNGGVLVPDFSKSRLWLRSGDYEFFSFSSLPHLQVGGMQTEGSAADTPLEWNNFLFTYKPIPLAQCLETLSLPSWQNYNDYSDYILSESSGIYLGKVDYQTIPLRKSHDNTNEVITFKPYSLTPDITIKFPVTKETGVVVDSIWGEVAGIPSAFDYSSNELKIDKTYKMLFRMLYPPMDNYADSAQAEALDVQATIKATAIVPSYSQKLTVGPGILHLAVYTHVCRPDGTKQVKVFRVCINMYHTLNRSGMLKWNPDRKCYEQGGKSKEYLLEISSPLRISKDRILNNEDDAIMEDWKELGRIDIDI